jgi:hypothetical protein
LHQHLVGQVAVNDRRQLREQGVCRHAVAVAAHLDREGAGHVEGQLLQPVTGAELVQLHVVEPPRPAERGEPGAVLRGQPEQRGSESFGRNCTALCITKTSGLA